MAKTMQFPDIPNDEEIEMQKKRQIQLCEGKAWSTGRFVVFALKQIQIEVTFQMNVKIYFK